jgi:hypothetical protein
MNAKTATLLEDGELFEEIISARDFNPNLRAAVPH